MKRNCGGAALRRQENGAAAAADIVILRHARMVALRNAATLAAVRRRYVRGAGLENASEGTIVSLEGCRRALAGRRA